MSRKTKTKKSIGKKQTLEIDQREVKILRNLKDEEAFHFYENIGKPTGESAKGLSDFLKKVSTIKLESLQFHQGRQDFQKWIKETLGDSKLAEKIGKLSPSNDEKLRAKIHETLEQRLRELKDTSITIEVNKDLMVETQTPTQQ